MNFVTAITLATKLLETIKAIRDIDKQLGEGDLKAKAAELLSNVADLKVALVEAREEATRKDKQIRQLKIHISVARGMRPPRELFSMQTMRLIETIARSSKNGGSTTTPTAALEPQYTD